MVIDKWWVRWVLLFPCPFIHSRWWTHDGNSLSSAGYHHHSHFLADHFVLWNRNRHGVGIPSHPPLWTTPPWKVWVPMECGKSRHYPPWFRWGFCCLVWTGDGISRGQKTPDPPEIRKIRTWPPPWGRCMLCCATWSVADPSRIWSVPKNDPHVQISICQSVLSYPCLYSLLLSLIL